MLKKDCLPSTNPRDYRTSMRRYLKDPPHLFINNDRIDNILCKSQLELVNQYMVFDSTNYQFSDISLQNIQTSERIVGSYHYYAHKF